MIPLAIFTSFKVRIWTASDVDKRLERSQVFLQEDKLLICRIYF